ncbi:MAG: diphosphate--fructose-6-phosphate 1-phosphotransferase [Opitutales bacterium]
MSEELSGNLLVAQVGEASPALNAALAGVVNEALNHGAIEEIYGALHGLQGVVHEDFIDLAEESQQAIRALSHSPGAVLGSGNLRVLQGTDLERAVDVLQAREVRFLVLCGGAEALEAAEAIDAQAQANSYRVCVIAVPVALDNSIPVTDHCPGYGSCIKDLSVTLRALASTAHSRGQHDYVSILGVSGTAAGWVAAGATMARRRNEAADPPQLVLMPERPFFADAFLQRVQDVLRQSRFCQVVVCDGLVDPDGNYVTSVAPTDPLAGYAAGGVAQLIRGVLETSLGGLRVEAIDYVPFQQVASLALSETDISEAGLSGAAAVKAVVAGETGKFVGLIRTDSDSYGVDTTLLSLADAAGRYKPLPDNWLSEDGMGVSYQFFKYANPLIQGEVPVPFENGLPLFARLNAARTEKVLPS